MNAKGKFELPNGTNKTCAYVKNFASDLCDSSMKVRSKCKATCNTCPVMKVSEAEEEDTEFECTLYQVQGLAVGHGNITKAIKCVDEKHDNDSYSLEDIPEDFDVSFESGKTKLTVSHHAITHDMEHGNIINLRDRNTTLVHESQDERNRFITNREGVHSMLIVRVTFYNKGTLEQPSKTGDQISAQVFNNLSGYSTCSGGRLSFVPASGNGINGGVMTIQVKRNLSDLYWDQAELQVTDALNNLGIRWNTYDFTSYVFPESIDFKGNGGFAYIDCYLSMFWDSQIMIKYMILHELGHNLGHNHSGDNVGNQYNDNSGLMGVGDKGGCFNAAKSWYFGWYSDRTKSIAPASSSWAGTLVPVSDYLKGQSNINQQVVVQVTGVGETDMYLMYNRVEDDITGDASIGDRVTVVSQEQDNAISIHLSSLGVNGVYRSPNWEGTGNDLVVKVCSIELGVAPSPCQARVLVYIDTGNNVPTCDGGGNGYTAGPTCDEKTWNKYVHKISGTRTITKSCGWLGKLKETKPGKARWYCKRAGRGTNPKASEICCQTCQEG